MESEVDMHAIENMIKEIGKTLHKTSKKWTSNQFKHIHYTYSSSIQGLDSQSPPLRWGFNPWQEA